AGIQDRVEVTLGQVRARVADFTRGPAVLEGPGDFPRRTDVQPHEGHRPAQEPEELGLTLRLKRQAHDRPQTRTHEGVPESPRLFLHANEVVGVQGRAERTGQSLGVPTGDPEPSVDDVQPRPGPPRAFAYHEPAHGSAAARLDIGPITNPRTARPWQGPPFRTRRRPGHDPGSRALRRRRTP